jgi:hypothetical protein
MNAKKIFMAATIAALGLTACTNDNEGSIPAREEVKISTSVKGNGRTTRAVIDPATGEGHLENGDKILLVAHKTGNAISFEEYTIGVSRLYWDNLISGNYSGTEWPEYTNYQLTLGEPPYNFIAYYPSIPSGELLAGFNAATAANPDLLGAKTEGVPKAGTVDLTFGHLMHKLTVNLSSNFYTSDDLVDAVVSVKNLYSTAAVELIDVAVDNGNASGTDPYPAETGISTCFIVAPQDLPAAGTELVEIVVGGKTYTYKIPTGLTALESGKALTLNLSVSRDAVTLQSNTVLPWDDQDEIDDNVPMS